MKKIKVELTFEAENGVDRKLLMNQVVNTIRQEYKALPVMWTDAFVQDIDAELQEPPKIDIIAVIDDLLNIHNDMLKDNNSDMQNAYDRGIVYAFDKVKNIIQRHPDSVILRPENHQLRGENLTLSMRLDKAEKLLLEANSILNIFSLLYTSDRIKEDCLMMIGEIAMFLNADETPGNAGLRTGIASAEVTYDPASGKEIAKTALENVLHAIEKYDNELDKKYEPRNAKYATAACIKIRKSVLAELNKLEA